MFQANCWTGVLIKHPRNGEKNHGNTPNMTFNFLQVSLNQNKRSMFVLLEYLVAVNITSMNLACSFLKFPPTKICLQGRRRIQVQSHRSRIGAKTCAGANGCNVVMLLVASHAGWHYGKGQVPLISSSLGWMLQQVPLKTLCLFYFCFMGEIHLTEPMAWDMIGTGKAIKAPFTIQRTAQAKSELLLL